VRCRAHKKNSPKALAPGEFFNGLTFIWN
jgi:hypothetical protein